MRTSIVLDAIHNIKFDYSFYPGGKTYDLFFPFWRLDRTENNNGVVASVTFSLVKEAFLHEAAAPLAASTFRLAFMERYSLDTSWVLGTVLSKSIQINRPRHCHHLSWHLCSKQ